MPNFADYTSRERARLHCLRQRLKFLRQRIRERLASGGAMTHFPQAEAAALEWALIQLAADFDLGDDVKHG